jgi:hypothetical protein
MDILAGMKVTNQDGLQGIVVRPGDSTKVVSLASGEMGTGY